MSSITDPIAARLRAGKKDDGGCIEEAYLLAFGRPVMKEERPRRRRIC